jgi:predicted metal-dependent hydrolase
VNSIALPDGQRIAYTLKVSANRRTIGLKIDANGLTVHVPKRVPQTLIDQVLHEKSDWIHRKLTARQQRPTAIAWQDGAELQFLGQSIRLSLRQDTRNRTVEYDGARLYVTFTTREDTVVTQRKVQQWYARQARQDFARRVEILAAKLGVPTPPVFLTNAKTRWGSCNSRGEIRLHWRLIQAPPQIIHYVVAHELAHLKEMNHSPAFWAWVQKLCPEYQSARNALKSLSAALHCL